MISVAILTAKNLKRNYDKGLKAKQGGNEMVRSLLATNGFEGRRISGMGTAIPLRQVRAMGALASPLRLAKYEEGHRHDREDQLRREAVAADVASLHVAGDSFDGAPDDARDLTDGLPSIGAGRPGDPDGPLLPANDGAGELVSA